MDIKELEAWLTEGLTDEQANIIRGRLNQESVKGKVSTLKQQKEYDAIVAQQQALATELDGADGKPGTRAYRDWYSKNAPVIEANAKAIEAYDKKFGQGAFVAAVAAEGGTPVAAPAAGGKQYTEADVQKMVDSRIAQQYGPQWTGILKGTGKILQKHLFAGRKTEIDFDKLADIAASKYAGNLEQAYDEYDKPEREAGEKKSREDEITRRVNEELQKRGASTHFPAGADQSSGALASRSKVDLDKFDRNTLKQDLVKTFLSGSDNVQ